MAFLPMDLAVVKSARGYLSVETRWGISSYSSRRWVWAQVSLSWGETPCLANRVEILTQDSWKV